MPFYVHERVRCVWWSVLNLILRVSDLSGAPGCQVTCLSSWIGRGCCWWPLAHPLTTRHLSSLGQTTPSSMCPGTTPWLTAHGQARGCPQRLSGNMAVEGAWSRGRGAPDSESGTSQGTLERSPTGWDLPYIWDLEPENPIRGPSFGKAPEAGAIF